MTWLAPWMLLGLLGLGLPVLAHFRARERPRKIRFAGLRFLGAGDEVTARRRRVRDRLLLLVRLLLLALVVVALARPVVVDQAEVLVLGGTHDAVVVLDSSLSMELQVDGRSLRQHAGDAALAVVAALPPGSRVGLVTSDPSGPRLDVSADAARVRAEISAWVDDRDRVGAWRLERALPVAAALLRQAGTGNPQAVYAVGDATARGLGSLPAQVGEDVPVLPVAVGGPVPEHIALATADWEPARDIDPRAVRVFGEVARYGGDAGPPRSVAVSLHIDGQAGARLEVDVPAGGRAGFEFTHIATSAGPSAATVALADVTGDALPGDEARHLWLADEDNIEVAVVNGSPSDLRAHDEVYFLATALAASTAAPRLRIHSLAPDQFELALREGTGLANIDVLVLANLRAPPEDIAPVLRDRVAAGMGLWISVGDRVEAGAYNDRLGDLLPLLLRESVIVGTAPGRTGARTEGLSPPNLAHPVLHGLQGELGLLGTRTRRVFLVDPDPSRAAEVALSFTSGAPALVTRSFGRGRVALLTTSVDRDWSDLPLRPGFVALVERLLTWLEADRAGGMATQWAGEPRTIAASGSVTLQRSDGSERVYVPDSAGEVKITATELVGHYRLTRSDGPPLFFAVQHDPEESDTTPVEIAKPQLAGDAVVAAAQVPRWRGLVLLALLLLLAETVLRWRQALASRSRPG